MKLTTKQNDDLAVHARSDTKEGHYIELHVETDSRFVLVFLTPMEAVRLGNALIKAAQPKQKKNAPTEAKKEQGLA